MSKEKEKTQAVRETHLVYILNYLLGDNLPLGQDEIITFIIYKIRRYYACLMWTSNYYTADTNSNLFKYRVFFSSFYNHP